MSVLINFKICDNAKECGGIAACPNDVLYWSEKDKSIKIDNDCCSSCGQCAEACEIGAISVAHNQEEYDKIKKEIDDDPRIVSDLFLDRFGAQPILPEFQISEDDFQVVVLESTKTVAVEFYNDDSVECLVKCIPITKLIRGQDKKYKKLKVEKDTLLEKFKISKLPSLVFFKDGKLIGKVEGFYGVDKEEELKTEIDKIIGK